MKAQPDGITRMQQQLAAQGGISQQLTLDDVDEAQTSAETGGGQIEQDATLASGQAASSAQFTVHGAADTENAAIALGTGGDGSVETRVFREVTPMEAPGHGVLGARGQVTDPVVIAWGLSRGEMIMLATGCILAAHPAYVQIGSRIEPDDWTIIPWHKIEAIVPAELPEGPVEVPEAALRGLAEMAVRAGQPSQSPGFSSSAAASGSWQAAGHAHSPEVPCTPACPAHAVMVTQKLAAGAAAKLAAARRELEEEFVRLTGLQPRAGQPLPPIDADQAARAAQEAHHAAGSYLPPSYDPMGARQEGSGVVPRYNFADLYAVADHSAQTPADE